MTLSEAQRAELRAKLPPGGYDGSVSSRAQIVLWHDEGHSAPEIAAMMGTSKVTVYKWLERYEEGGLVALESRKSTGRPREVSGEVRSRILALTKQSPPDSTGLSHWSSYEMARYLRRHEGIRVSHNFISVLWRENGIQPHRQGTFKLSRDPDFTAKVIDVVGLYLDPPAGAVVLSVDEKTQVQALDRTQPLLPVSFSKTEKRTHDYKRVTMIRLRSLRRSSFTTPSYWTLFPAGLLSLRITWGRILTRLILLGWLPREWSSG